MPLLFVFLAACGPSEGAPCDAATDGAVCAGTEVLLCVCDAPDDDGTCPADDGTWQIDAACSCDLTGSMTCS